MKGRIVFRQNVDKKAYMKEVNNTKVKGIMRDDFVRDVLWHLCKNNMNVYHRLRHFIRRFDDNYKAFSIGSTTENNVW